MSDSSSGSSAANVVIDQNPMARMVPGFEEVAQQMLSKPGAGASTQARSVGAKQTKITFWLVLVGVIAGVLWSVSMLLENLHVVQTGGAWVAHGTPTVAAVAPVLLPTVVPTVRPTVTVAAVSGVGAGQASPEAAAPEMAYCSTVQRGDIFFTTCGSTIDPFLAFDLDR